MSIILPLAAENYLIESGLSPAEILVVKKLLEENYLTARELSAKTGKGNSSIDASLKKLMQRGIVTKEKFNDQPRYTVIDPQALVAWAEKTLKERAELMKRRHQSFAQFVGSLSNEKSHPVIEHFEGEEGIMKAYDKLLEYRTELLTYFDPENFSDDESQKTFHHQYTRQRQVHGIFQRIIAPDSPAARRFRTRDPLEYRKTVLVPEDEYPVSFSKVIVGDVVACIDTKNADASFIHFPALAESERVVFEKLWEKQIERDKNESSNVKEKALTVSLWDQFKNINDLQKICLGFLGFFCAYWLLLFIAEAKHGFFNDFYNIYSLPPTVFGVIGMLTIKRWGGLKTAIGKAVFFVGLGLFSWGVGNAIFMYHNFILHVPVPYPSISDAFFLPGVFFYGLGIFFLSGATGARYGLRNPYAKIFVVVSPMIVLIISYYLFIVVARDGVLLSKDGGVMKALLDIAFPLQEFLNLTIAIQISGLSFKYMRGMYTLSIWAILLGTIGMFFGDVIFGYTTTIGTYYVGNLGDLAYVTGLSLLSFGLLGFCKEKMPLNYDQQIALSYA